MTEKLTTSTIIQCMNYYKADYHHRLIPCSATMVVVCLVVIQKIINYQPILKNANIKHVPNNYIDYKYNNTMQEWLQGRLQQWAYSMFSNHGGSLSCAVDVMHRKHSNTIKQLKNWLQVQ